MLNGGRTQLDTTVWPTNPTKGYIELVKKTISMKRRRQKAKSSGEKEEARNRNKWNENYAGRFCTLQTISNSTIAVHLLYHIASHHIISYPSSLVSLALYLSVISRCECAAIVFVFVFVLGSSLIFSLPLPFLFYLVYLIVIFIWRWRAEMKGVE